MLYFAQVKKNIYRKYTIYSAHLVYTTRVFYMILGHLKTNTVFLAKGQISFAKPCLESKCKINSVDTQYYV